LSVAAVREGASEPGIIVERVVDSVCAVWGRLGWPAGVVGDLSVVQREGSLRCGGPAGRGGRGVRDRRCWGGWQGGWRRASGEDVLDGRVSNVCRGKRRGSLWMRCVVGAGRRAVVGCGVGVGEGGGLG